MKIYAARTYELSAADEERLCKLLDRDRIGKLLTLKNRKERARSIFAGLLLRYAFLQAGHDEEAWQHAEIVKGEYGKPHMEGYDDFHYSLSHSGEWSICAADTVPVGADIQEMRSWKLRLAERFYHKDEYNRLLALEESDQDRQTAEFYSMWAAKESAAKLSGRGIGAGISHYVTDADYRSIHDIGQGQVIPIRRYDTLQGYIVCVCSETGSFPESFERIGL